MLENRSVIYSDISYDGKAIQVDADNIVKSVVTLLSFEPGSRFFYTDYGSSPESLLFKLDNQITRTTFISSLKYKLLKFEPRIRDLEISIISSTDNSVTIDIKLDTVIGNIAKILTFER